MDLSKVVPVARMQGETSEETACLKQMLHEAETFLSSFDWCQAISESYFGFGICGVVAVFLFRIVPRHEGIDEWLWVVVGDLPPAYLVAEDNPTPTSALEAYIKEMSAWVDAADHGKPTDELIPVNVPATPENAQELRTRLTLLRKRVIPLYANGTGD